MRTEIMAKHDHRIHHATLSWWDKLATSLCGTSLPAKAYRERLLYGGVNCPDCKRAKRLATQP